jgi:hypothetical protein
MGLKDVLLQDGPRLAMMAMAGLHGGTQGASAFMRGQQINQAQQANAQHQQQADMRAQEMQQAQLANIEADNARANEQQGMERLKQALALIEREAAAQENTPDPVQAENAVMQKAASAASIFGMAPDALTGMVPNMTPKVAAAKKRRAKEVYAEFVKTYGPQAADLGMTAKMESGEFADMTFAQIGQMAEAVTPPPAASKVAAPPQAGSFEEYVNAPPERQAVIEGARKRYMQADDRPLAAKPPAGPDGLTPNARLDGTLRLRDRFIKETQAAQTVNTQLRLMKSSLEAVRSGAAAPGSQGVLVTFQKILDPTSVVRESEYARSASGLSLISRMEGAWDKITKGGAGVPVHDLEQFVTLAEQFVRNQAQAAEMTKQQIESIAKESGLNPANITRELDLPGGGAEAAGPKVGERRNFNGKVGEWDGKGWKAVQ